MTAVIFLNKFKHEFRIVTFHLIPCYLAEAVLQADTMIKSSINISFTFPQELWMMNTSKSRTVSSIFTFVSLLLNFLKVLRPTGIDKWLQIISANLGCELPLNTAIWRIFCFIKGPVIFYYRKQRIHLD
jgi:hypothetical protein